MELVAIHSNRLMAYLILRKFVLIKTDINKINRLRNVYLFSDSIKIRKAMEEYKTDNDFHKLVEQLNSKYLIKKE